MVNQKSLTTFILMFFLNTHIGIALPYILDHLHSHCSRKFGNNCGHKDQSQTSKTYVLFSHPSCIFAYLLFQCTYTQTLRDLGYGRENYLLQRMHDLSEVSQAQKAKNHMFSLT
jgi:hypothetical protein